MTPKCRCATERENHHNNVRCEEWHTNEKNTTKYTSNTFTTNFHKLHSIVCPPNRHYAWHLPLMRFHIHMPWWRNHAYSHTHEGPMADLQPTNRGIHYVYISNYIIVTWKSTNYNSIIIPSWHRELNCGVCWDAWTSYSNQIHNTCRLSTPHGCCCYRTCFSGL